MKGIAIIGTGAPGLLYGDMLQRAVKREQGTVNREQEKLRTKRYNRDKGYVPAIKM